MRLERSLGALALALSLLGAEACGSDDDGGGSGGGTSGGSGGASGGSSGASGGSSGAGGASGSGGASGGAGGSAGDATVEAATCDPAVLPDAWASPLYKPVRAPSSACTTDMIKDYATKCQGANEPPCSAFQADGDAALAACEVCLWSKPSDASWGPLLTFSKDASALNIAGCFESLGGEGAAECALSYHQLTSCRAEVCKACSGATLGGCEAAADTGPCKSYADAEQTACQPFAAGDCASGGQKAKQALFTALCGAAGDGGSGDAGPDAADASGG